VAALGLAGTVLVAAAPPAHADFDTCPSGHACLFLLPQERLLFHSEGNANPFVTMPGDQVGYVWNNGTYYPGLDHLQVYSVSPGGSAWTICLHYGPKTDPFGFPPRTAVAQPTAAYVIPGDTITAWYWRGECANWEDDGWSQIS
jgi:hypothetical protein